ncbi:MAG: HD domain-containing protein [Deltaproteobacteria bacterium]|nr:HD domain-containing protein [Deltaproteobacteria bacterium]
MDSAALQGIVRSFLIALRMRDESTYRHSKKVMYYALKIAHQMGLDRRQQSLLKWASLLHDIGKLVVSDAMLKGNGRLKAHGASSVRNHQSLGVEILSSVEALGEILPIIRGHHERYDGTGYPDGLHGKKIPLLSRILALTDAYEAMTRVRPYNIPLTRLHACQELQKNAGTQFDPGVVDAFSRYLKVDQDPLVSILIAEHDIYHFYLLFKMATEMGCISLESGFSLPVIDRALCSERYDMIVIDTSVTWMDGMELVRLVKERFPFVRLALMSTGRTVDLRRQAQELDAFAYLHKPVSRENFFDVVDRIAEEKISL